MNKNDKFIIAIDGPSVSGKGTVARMLATRLGIMCLDTGALYRGMTIYFMQRDLLCKEGNDVTDEQVSEALKTVKLEPRCDMSDGTTHIYLNGVDVTENLHDLEVCENVFRVSPNPLVRAKMRTIQHDIGENNTLVCEGRDITSVVFPNARFKFFLTADLDVRAQRRHKQEVEKGSGHTLEHVRSVIAARDHADMTRELSPLMQTPDAVVVDATYLTPTQVVDKMIEVINA